MEILERMEIEGNEKTQDNSSNYSKNSLSFEQLAYLVDISFQLRKILYTGYDVQAYLLTFGEEAIYEGRLDTVLLEVIIAENQIWRNLKYQCPISQKKFLRFLKDYHIDAQRLAQLKKEL